MDPADFERRYRALGVFSTLKNVSDYLATVRGRRKAVILFSEGVDYPMTDVFGSMSATEVQRALQDTITAAARGNVNFSTIDPRGLAGITSGVHRDGGRRRGQHHRARAATPPT